MSHPENIENSLYRYPVFVQYPANSNCKSQVWQMARIPVVGDEIQDENGCLKVVSVRLVAIDPSNHYGLSRQESPVAYCTVETTRG
ncbi:hypothetical protein C7B61_00355 [filamentous cyanobacterium CCP1]|nr:hypothetical protein C7B61_00355 [filamentous cyanobacterium CCP1]